MGEPKGFLVVPVGYNPSDIIRALELDASDRLIVTDDQLKTILGNLTFDGSSRLIVTDPQVLAKMAVLSLDGSGRLIVTDPQVLAKLVALTLDGSGHLEVAEQGTPTVNSQRLSRFAGAWQKQPIQFGFADTVSQEIYVANAAAGANYLVGTVVPANEVWVINFTCAVDINSAATLLLLIATVDAIDIVQLRVAPMVAGTWYNSPATIVLGPGDNVKATFGGCVLNDDLYFRYCGYKFNTNL